MTYFTSKLDHRILHLSFEDPSTRNSLSVAAARELRSHIERAQKSGGFDALVFSSRGRVFCSGGNLADYASMTTSAEGMKVNDEIRSTLALLTNLDVPTICEVNGDCFGGGVELVSCFDYVMASPHVVFALWQRRISLTYGWGGGSRLERRLGSALLRSLSLSARAVGAREALEYGLCDELVSESQLGKRVLELARAMAALPKEPVGSFKSFSSEVEAELFNALWWNETHKAVLEPRRKS